MSNDHFGVPFVTSFFTELYGKLSLTSLKKHVIILPRSRNGFYSLLMGVFCYVRVRSI